MFHRLGKGGTRYWGTSGAGIFFTNGKKVLLLKRDGTDQKDKWGIPGGKTEKGESPIDTAMRESREECGHVKGRRIESYESNDNSHYWVTFLFAIDEPFECQISKEHSEWKWVDFDQLSRYDLHPKFKEQLPRIMRGVRKHFINDFDFKEWLSCFS